MLVIDAAITFRLNGETKRLDYRKLPLSTWSALKAELSFTPITLMRALREGDVEAIGALIWLERKQHDRDLKWGKVRAELEREDQELTYEFVDLDTASALEVDPTDAGN